MTHRTRLQITRLICWILGHDLDRDGLVHRCRRCGDVKDYRA